VRALSVCVLLAACGGGGDNSAARREAEKECREAREQVAEARGWLARGNTMGFELDKEDMRELAEELYAAGAAEVEVGYSLLDDEDPASPEVGGYFVIVLPRAAAARKGVFTAFNQLAADFDLTLARDLGQSCLVLGLD
jgi:hypothetical protein